MKSGVPGGTDWLTQPVPSEVKTFPLAPEDVSPVPPWAAPKGLVSVKLVAEKVVAVTFATVKFVKVTL
jgi:hypothetical protein